MKTVDLGHKWEDDGKRAKQEAEVRFQLIEVHHLLKVQRRTAQLGR